MPLADCRVGCAGWQVPWRHGFGPAGCAVLLKARFDRRLDCCPSGDLGGRPVHCVALFTTKARDRPAVEALVEAGFEEGRAADRATTMLEAPARTIHRT